MLLVPLLALQVAEADVVVLGDGVDDLLDGDAPLFGGAGLAQRGLGEIEVDPALLEHGHALDLGDRAFQLAGVVLDLGGDVADDVFGQCQAAQRGLLLQDRDAGLVARLFDPRDQAPVEAADEPLFQLGDFARRAVGD